MGGTGPLKGIFLRLLESKVAWFRPIIWNENGYSQSKKWMAQRKAAN